MSIRLKFFVIFVSLSILIGIIELVRSRKLKEEYSVLWLITGFILLIVTLKYELLVAITNFIGAVLAINTLFFLGLIFVILLSLEYSLKISSLTTQVRNLAQKLALLEGKELPFLLDKKSKIEHPNK